MLNTLILLAKRAVERTESELARQVWLTTLHSKIEPKRKSPATLSELPSLQNERMLKELPRLSVFRMDALEPKRDTERTLTAEPR